MDDVQRYNDSLRQALGWQIDLLMANYPKGVRNVLTGKIRLFFQYGKVYVGAPGQMSSTTELSAYAHGTATGMDLCELLYGVSRYVWQRMHNTGFGVDMPNVELPSQRKTSVLPAGVVQTGYSDPRHPSVRVDDAPPELPPGSPRQISSPTPKLPPGK